MKVISKSKSVGDACWNIAYAEKMLSPIAHVGDSSADWFMAIHSPIKCKDNLGTVSERDIFSKLFETSKPETLYVIKGESGTGKSQLINWLKLAFDDAKSNGSTPPHLSPKIRAVMIKRRSGSLKDALEQLVSQLPEYENYLSDIQSAIQQVSSDLARRTLAFQISNTLYTEQDNRPRKLKLLHSLFNDNGYLDWLCRDEGGIAKNISRLTSGSDQKDRESLPQFIAEDFKLAINIKSGVDQNLIEELIDDPSLREIAAQEVNKHLRTSITALTGLRGQTLHDVFRKIREGMKVNGEDLALFIEDVSTLSVLDEELVNVLEPQNDNKLCNLISVLGMTTPAYNRLPTNLQGRIDKTYELTSDGIIGLQQDEEYTDKFIARYMNALRADPIELGSLALDVRQYGEQQRSACDSCQIKESCFESFGSVKLGDIEVGLNPFTPGTATRLLEGLSEPYGLRTPRILLLMILLPLLEAVPKHFKNYPGINVDVTPRQPSDLFNEESKYLSGWSSTDKNKISFFSYYWTGESLLVRSVAKLARILPWFGLQKFTADIKKTEETKPERTLTLKPTEEKPVSPETQIPIAFTRMMERLDSWYQKNESLQSDSDFRELIVKVIKESIPLEEYRNPSSRTRRLTTLGTGNIYIEGMVAKPRKSQFIFNRDQSTYDLLRTLLVFEHLGKRSWNFNGSESQRIIYANWLSENRERIVSSYNTEKSDKNEAVKIAVIFLVMAYRFSERKNLPSNISSSIELLLNFSPKNSKMFTDDGDRLLADMGQRIIEIREFLTSELSVPQGNSASINYIDPTKFIEYLPIANQALEMPDIKDEIFETDFPLLKKLLRSRWSDLSSILSAEHEELNNRISSIWNILSSWGVINENLDTAVKDFFISSKEVVKSTLKAGHSLGDIALQNKLNELSDSKIDTYVNVIACVKIVSDSTECNQMLLQDFDEFIEISNLIIQVDKVLKSFEVNMKGRLLNTVTENEVITEKNRAIASLKKLENLSPSFFYSEEFLELKKDGEHGE